MAFVSTGCTLMRERFADMDEDCRRRACKLAFCVGGVIALRHVGGHVYRYFDQRRSRQKKLDQVRTTKGKLLQKLVGLKTPIENRDVLTKLTYQEMLEQLDKDELKALNLLEAFQAKSLEENPRLNSVNEVIYEADVTALYLDSLSKKERGALHGFPLTMSDTIDMKGHDTPLGSASRCHKASSRTDPALLALEAAGMAPFARTNSPQLGMGLACDNPVFGCTTHPTDPQRSPGPCGGEAALIAAGGSVAGLSVDRHGGLRLSAAFCGIFGFRPTAARIGEHLLREPAGRVMPVQAPFYRSCVGPLTRDVDLLCHMVRALYSPVLFDVSPRVPRLPFDEERFGSGTPMRVGLFCSLPGHLPPTPAVLRALQEAKAALQRRGHTVVDWEPPSPKDLLVRPLMLDGGAVYVRSTAREAFLSPTLRRLRKLGSLPAHLKLLLAAGLWLFSPLVSRRLCLARGERSPSTVLDLSAAIEDFRERFAAAWDKAGLDAVLCPAANSAAPLISDGPLSVDLSYTALFNLLDYPAGVVPVGQVTEEDCRQLQGFPRRDFVARRVARSQSAAKGLPLAVQCAAPRFQDEVALRLMCDVRGGLTE